MQDCQAQPQSSSLSQSKEQDQLDSQTSFLTLSSDFKFLVVTTSNKSINLVVIQGKLIFNNGCTVLIGLSHKSFVNKCLNLRFDPLKRTITFEIDESSETLIFTTKTGNANDPQERKQFVKTRLNEILRMRKHILSVLAVIGIPLDSENAIMRKILIAKKNLKINLESILKNSNDRIQESMQVQEQQSEQDGGFICFGEGTDYVLVKEKQQNKRKQDKISEGGYFSIEPTPFVVKDRWGKTISNNLVVKKLRQNRKMTEASLSQNQRKMTKQLQIIHRIKNKKYLIRYYCDAASLQNLSEVYMQKYSHSLQQYIHYLDDSLQYLHKIDISKQVVYAILTLHQSGIVHRDIKPANILIDDSDGKYRVKIIDFAQSYPLNTQKDYSNIDYACSHPYSPLECIERKGFTEKGPMEGIGRKEIDNWSVGFTIYQIFFRKLPVSFSRAFLVDITSSWKNELLVAVNQRQKIGFSLLDDIINIICVKTMKFVQEQRLKLIIIKKILEYLEVYVKNLLQIVEETQAS